MDGISRIAQIIDAQMSTIEHFSQACGGRLNRWRRKCRTWPTCRRLAIAHTISWGFTLAGYIAGLMTSR